MNGLISCHFCGGPAAVPGSRYPTRGRARAATGSPSSSGLPSFGGLLKRRQVALDCKSHHMRCDASADVGLSTLGMRNLSFDGGLPCTQRLESGQSRLPGGLQLRLRSVQLSETSVANVNEERVSLCSVNP